MRDCGGTKTSWRSANAWLPTARPNLLIGRRPKGGSKKPSNEASDAVLHRAPRNRLRFLDRSIEPARIIRHRIGDHFDGAVPVKRLKRFPLPKDEERRVGKECRSRWS